MHTPCFGLDIQPLHLAAFIGKLVICYHSEDFAVLFRHKQFALGSSIFMCWVFQFIFNVLKRKITSETA